jgi:UDP-N-acetylmuramoyl-L-alanyl-D-glutamate--2,6-diaminopimelate ligase
MWEELKKKYHWSKAVLANLWFGFPSRRILVIGVTGTNGKTTTTQLIAAILRESGAKVALSSTINFQLDKKEWINRTKFTTPSAWDFQKFIKAAVKEKCDYLVAEISSHALEQNRVWGTKFRIAVLTNITREHLDYHGSMSAYRKSKSRLFKMVSKSGGAGVVNLSLSKIQKFVPYELKDNVWVYGFKKENPKRELPFSNRLLGEIEKKKEGDTIFSVNGDHFLLKLLGEFNVENALAALSVAKILKIPASVSATALARIKGIPGRLEEVANKKGFKIIIDYALTPDSMEKIGLLLLSQKSTIDSRLFWVFGACGQRDRGKRPIMGEIASKFADFLILTNEDPYGEDPKIIVKEILGGILSKNNSQRKKFKQDKNLFVIMNRREAIRKALSLAQPGDTILLTGKGAEENIKIGKKLYPWNERKVVEELLGE